MSDKAADHEYHCATTNVHFQDIDTRIEKLETSVDALTKDTDRRFADMGQGQFTITKQMEILSLSINGMKDSVLKSHESLAEVVKAHAQILDGYAGSPGLKIDNDRLKQADLPKRVTELEQERWKQIGANAVVMLLINIGVAVFVKIVWR